MTTLHNDFPSFQRLQQILLLIGMGLSHRIVCNSHATRDSIPQWARWILAGKDFRVSYNGVNLDELRAIGKPRASRSATSTGKLFTVGTVARLVSQKDLATMIRGFAKFHKQTPASRLVIIGDGTLRGELQELSAKLQIEDAVVFRGRLRRKDVYQALSEFDVFAVSSTFEGFCNAMVEAMAAGVPVVASDIKVLEEVLGKECGTFFKTGDPTDLATKLGDLHDNRLRRDKLAALCRDFATSRYSIESCAASYMQHYEELARAA